MGHHADETPISVIRSLLAQIEAVRDLAGAWYIGTERQDSDLEGSLLAASRIVTKVLERRETILLDAMKDAA